MHPGRGWLGTFTQETRLTTANHFSYLEPPSSIKAIRSIMETTMNTDLSAALWNTSRWLSVNKSPWKSNVRVHLDNPVKLFKAPHKQPSTASWEGGGKDDTFGESTGASWGCSGSRYTPYRTLRESNHARRGGKKERVWFKAFGVAPVGPEVKTIPMSGFRRPSSWSIYHRRHGQKTLRLLSAPPALSFRAPTPATGWE